LGREGSIEFLCKNLPVSANYAIFSNVIGKFFADNELSNNKTIENYSGKKKNELNSQLRPIKI
jgi:hypothetical protein